MQVIADFRVKFKAEMDAQLDAAIATARSAAFAARTHGVLVTRHDFGHFTMALSPEVPFGLVLEQDHARRNSSAQEPTARAFQPNTPASS